MSLPSRLLGANPSIQVSTLLSGSLTTPSAKQAFIEPNSFESIATYTLSSSQTSITFSSIPQTYTHLQLRGIVRFAGNDGGFGAYLNNDTTTSNYRSRQMAGAGSSVGSGGAMQDSFVGWTIATSSMTSGVFTAMIFDFLDYSSSTKNKTMRIFSGHDNNGSGQIRFSSVLWKNTSAVSTIKLDSTNQGSTSSFAQHTTFALYGIKGA